MWAGGLFLIVLGAGKPRARGPLAGPAAAEGPLPDLQMYALLCALVVHRPCSLLIWMALLAQAPTPPTSSDLTISYSHTGGDFCI